MHPIGWFPSQRNMTAGYPEQHLYVLHIEIE